MVKLLRPHQPPQSLLFLLAAKDDIDALPGKVAYLGPGEAKVFCYKGVFVGERAAEDAYVVGLLWKERDVSELHAPDKRQV